VEEGTNGLWNQSQDSNCGSSDGGSETNVPKQESGRVIKVRTAGCSHLRLRVHSGYSFLVPIVGVPPSPFPFCFFRYLASTHTCVPIGRWAPSHIPPLSEGYDITEYEAAFRLTEYRSPNKHFMGLTHEAISPSGPNAALPHYSPTKSTVAVINRDTPYLNDSGGPRLRFQWVRRKCSHNGRPRSQH